MGCPVRACRGWGAQWGPAEGVVPSEEGGMPNGGLQRGGVPSGGLHRVPSDGLQRDGVPSGGLQRDFLPMRVSSLWQSNTQYFPKLLSLKHSQDCKKLDIIFLTSSVSDNYVLL